MSISAGLLHCCVSLGVLLLCYFLPLWLCVAVSACFVFPVGVASRFRCLVDDVDLHRYWLVSSSSILTRSKRVPVPHWLVE